MSKKTFTLEEVHQLLPELQKKIEQLIRKKEAYTRMHDHLLIHELLSESEKNRGLEPEQDAVDDHAHELESAVDEIRQEADEIRKLGCLIDDLDQGWVDFPGHRDGKSVYYSWKCGQTRIEFYYCAAETPKRRQPI
ncbi:MAG: DUF2203 family protein [Candidatus Omnitrophica bacterium]|nr:DUF2203 family protein [Candidatus Omnitrophota bacterium]